VEHQLLALVHVVHDDQLVGIAQHALPLGEERRNDARDAPAVLEDRAGELAHQSEAAPAIDETNAVSRHQGAERARGLPIGGIVTDVGAAVDADAADAVRSCRLGFGFLHAALGLLAAIAHTLPCSCCFCHATAPRLLNR